MIKSTERRADLAIERLVAGRSSPDSVLKRRDTLLEYSHRRIHYARIDVTKALESEKICRLISILEDIRARLIDRRAQMGPSFQHPSTPQPYAVAGLEPQGVANFVDGAGKAFVARLRAAPNRADSNDEAA
jgi:hypothetical protein